MTDTDRITAEELERSARNWDRDGFGGYGDYLRRAAATIRALEAELTDFRDCHVRATLRADEAVADAELGALVRKIREHPMRGDNGPVAYVYGPLPMNWGFTKAGLTAALDYLDSLTPKPMVGATVKSGDTTWTRGLDGWRAMVQGNGCLGGMAYTPTAAMSAALDALMKEAGK